MISLQYVQLMARYNEWQNTSLVTAADKLTDADRQIDRGAFFQCIDRTFRHLLWDDQLWLARFQGDARPEASFEVDLDEPQGWESFRNERDRVDATILEWASNLSEADLEGEVVWYPGGGTTQMSRPRWQAIAHLFNHQTHHRGQIHGMLTSAGTSPEPTDLPILTL